MLWLLFFPCFPRMQWISSIYESEEDVHGLVKNEILILGDCSLNLIWFGSERKTADNQEANTGYAVQTGVRNRILAQTVKPDGELVQSEWFKWRINLSPMFRSPQLILTYSSPPNSFIVLRRDGWDVAFSLAHYTDINTNDECNTWKV